MKGTIIMVNIFEVVTHINSRKLALAPYTWDEYNEGIRDAFLIYVTCENCREVVTLYPAEAGGQNSAKMVKYNWSGTDESIEICPFCFTSMVEETLLELEEDV